MLVNHSPGLSCLFVSQRADDSGFYAGFQEEPTFVQGKTTQTADCFLLEWRRGNHPVPMWEEH